MGIAPIKTSVIHDGYSRGQHEYLNHDFTAWGLCWYNQVVGDPHDLYESEHIPKIMLTARTDLCDPVTSSQVF